jgi:hypothetical protein
MSETKRNWIRLACVSLVHLKYRVLFFCSFCLLVFSLRCETRGNHFFAAKETKTVHFRFEYMFQYGVCMSDYMFSLSVVKIHEIKYCDTVLQFLTTPNTSDLLISSVE